MILNVAGEIVARSHELARVEAVLERARHAPTALILAGEAGIGKTTVWRASAEWARGAGFGVLTTAGAAAEVALAWTGPADLLTGIDDAVLARLPALHQRALGAVSTGEAGPLPRPFRRSGRPPSTRPTPQCPVNGPAPLDR
ncbi:ATP-binding protein [Mycobacterium sp. RTGN5]|uniref:ATP-binding protein n=1 Tax=Mycobacterium sp. RTGN5 TaxID=3016522 RepID=UPI0029C6E825|nr:ATP-binding protein [Mycobacterium sp. RTGN5]